MNYRKEYATLVGLVDRAIAILEQREWLVDAADKAEHLLLSALHAAEARYMEQPEEELL